MYTHNYQITYICIHTQHVAKIFTWFVCFSRLEPQGPSFVNPGQPIQARQNLQSIRRWFHGRSKVLDAGPCIFKSRTPGSQLGLSKSRVPLKSHGKKPHFAQWWHGLFGGTNRIFGQSRLRLWRCEATVRPGVVMTAPGAQGTAKITVDVGWCWGLPIYWMMLTSIYIYMYIYIYMSGLPWRPLTFLVQVKMTRL